MNRGFMQLAVLALVGGVIACASPPKERGVAGAPMETGVASAPVSDIAYLSAPLEAGDVFGVDSAPGHGGGGHKVVSADSAPGHGGGGHLKARDHCYYDTEKKQFVCDFPTDSAPGHGGGGHKVGLLMECKEKDPNRVACTAPVGTR